MNDALIKDQNVLNQSKLDLLFVKENKNRHNMDFETFLNLITKIASYKYPDLSPLEAL